MNNDFFISGIQQVGIGTVDFRKTWNWMIRYFGADTKILEDDTVAERMLPYTGNQAQKRHACIACNIQGGGGFEIWQYSERKPVPCPFEIAIGDLGIFAAKINSSNVQLFYDQLPKEVVKTKVAKLANSWQTFYVRDLYNNLFQIIPQPSIYLPKGRVNGGIGGVMIGVTDMAKSVQFYANVLGYDSIVYDETGVFQDWKELKGGDEHYRRVLLQPSTVREGAFAELLGPSTIELVQALDRKPRKIYEGRYWGDPGFIQICFDVHNMAALKEFCAEKGHPFTVDSCPDGEVFDMGEASGHFTYIEDPDGTLIEFVETYKIPIYKKLGWYLDFRKRDPKKPLPPFLFRLLSWAAKEPIRE